MSNVRQVLRQSAIVLVVGVALAASFVGAFHDPRPHGMPVGVVGPASRVTRLQTAAAAHDPGALSIHRYPTATAAVAAIEHRRIDGAVVLGQSRAQRLVASAAGSQTVQTMQRAFTSASLRAPVSTHDLAPLPVADRDGLGPFLFVLTLVIPSLLLGVALTVGDKNISVAACLAGAAAFAIVLGLLDALVSDVVYRALGGGYLQLAGLGMLISFVASSVTIGLGRLLGPAGLVLTAIGLVIVGVPASGAAVGPAFVPSFFSALHPILPTGQALDAVRNAVYFSGHATWDKLGLLGGWALLGVITAAIGARWSLPAMVARRARMAGPIRVGANSSTMAEA